MFKVGDEVKILSIKDDLDDLLALTNDIDVVGMIGEVIGLWSNTRGYSIGVYIKDIGVECAFKESELELI